MDGGDVDDQLFDDEYYNPAKTSAYLGARNFKRELNKHNLKYKNKDVDDWLLKQEPYTLHKRIVNKFQRRNTITPGPEVQFQADLLDVQSHSKDNDGYKYILTVIDVFSKKAWAIPLKNKGGNEVSAALDGIFDRIAPLYLQTDKGKEFYNASVANVLTKHNVIHFSTENDNIKASIVERFNQTLRVILHRAFTKLGRYRYLDILEDVVRGYNNRVNSNTGVAPNEVDDITPDQREDVFLRLHDNSLHFKKTANKFEVGDAVRLVKTRGAFQRGYTPNWTREIFYITQILKTSPTTYRVVDYNKEELAGTFYHEELQKVREPEEYAVESILERKKIGGKKMVLVKWMGYPDAFNSWIPESEIKDI